MHRPVVEPGAVGLVVDLAAEQEPVAVDLAAAVEQVVELELVAAEPVAEKVSVEEELVVALEPVAEEVSVELDLAAALEPELAAWQQVHLPRVRRFQKQRPQIRWV
jgi:hypothetical protein